MSLYSDDNLSHVLKKDGVERVLVGEKYENFPCTGLDKIKEQCGEPPWAVRLVYNKRFGGVMICQKPGEGNRLHYHPDADECWVILEGEWKWYIEGEGTQNVREKDIVLVKQGTMHQITCVGDVPGIRFAITAPDVSHVYKEERKEDGKSKV
jgi:mannose-6-phosphate isomerase-like protein (cupin superfamily)